MADIRKRVGKKGTTYQVRYPSKSTASGYAFKSFDTLKEARAFTENLGSLPIKASSHIRSVPQAIQEWLDVREKVGRDGRERVERETLKEYRRRANVMNEYEWPKPLQELLPPDIVQFRNWLLKNKSRDLARRTLSSFHSVVIEMKLHGHINHDPAAGITIKSGGRYEEDEARIDIPSDQDVRDMLAAADLMGSKNDYMAKCWARYRPMIYLAAFSGMRASEIRGLPWYNLYPDHVEITQRADKMGHIGPVKSRAARRHIELSSRVTDLIFEWRECCPMSGSDLVFPTAHGKPIALHNFTQSAWIPLLKEAGLVYADKTGAKEILRPKYTPHSLRHYYASKLIEKRKDAKFIQERLGHSKIEVTMNVYGHLMKDREAAHQKTAEELADELLPA